MAREYRGARNVESLKRFMLRMLDDSVRVFDTRDEREAIMKDLDCSTGCIIGSFVSAGDGPHQEFVELANMLRDDCKFMATFGGTQDTLTYTDGVNETPFKASLEGDEGVNALRGWIVNTCPPRS